jgi:uracil phosphoribosyltransferase
MRSEAVGWRRGLALLSSCRRGNPGLQLFERSVIMQQQRAGLTVVDHPLVQHKLSLMRDRDTSTAEFRRLLREVSLLLAYEATRDLPLEPALIETPLERGSFPVIAGKKLCLVSILRAGNGILDGMIDLLPSARVGHIGIYREPRTLQAVEYYLKLPEDLAERDVILVDPMLATGNSAVAAISRLVELKARSIKFVCLVAAPEGVDTVLGVFPDVAIVAAALDRCLDDHGYILPGLGDAGDRLFGTK